MREFRKPGRHNAPGVTRTEIFHFLLDYPDGIDEYTIREHIYHALSIREPRSVRNQLEELKLKGKISHKSGMWEISPFDRESFREFWTKLNFETKLRLLPKRVVQNHIEDTIYPEFIDQIEYDPTGFFARLSRLKLGGDLPIPYNFRCPLSKLEEGIIRASFRTMPTMVDFQLNLRPEIDVMAFDLVGHLVRLHPEKGSRYFTPGYFGLLYVLIARRYFVSDLTSSEILPHQVKHDCYFWISVPFMETFNEVIPDNECDEIAEILRIAGEFSGRLIDPRDDQDDDKNMFDEGDLDEETLEKRQIDRQKTRRIAAEKWVMLAQDWPGCGIAPPLSEDDTS